MFVKVFLTSSVHTAHAVGLLRDVCPSKLCLDDIVLPVRVLSADVPQSLAL